MILDSSNTHTIFDTFVCHDIDMMYSNVIQSMHDDNKHGSIFFCECFSFNVDVMKFIVLKHLTRFAYCLISKRIDISRINK